MVEGFVLSEHDSKSSFVLSCRRVNEGIGVAIYVFFNSVLRIPKDRVRRVEEKGYVVILYEVAREKSLVAVSHNRLNSLVQVEVPIVESECEVYVVLTDIAVALILTVADNA